MKKFKDIGNALTDAFVTDCRAAGFISTPRVSLTSGIDASTLFVGSSISVFKQDIFASSCLFPAKFVVQPCLRTRNLKYLFDENVLPQWGSYFVALGLIAPPDQGASMHRFIKDFLVHRAFISPERLVFRVNAEDADLVAILANDEMDTAVEKNQFPETYYRHVYGMPCFLGRNYNFGIRQTNGEVLDVGNLVVVEHNGVPAFIDIGLGVSTLISRAMNISHPLKSSVIADIMTIESTVSIKLADALTVSCHLLSEGLKPSSNSRGKILRAYLQAIPALADASGVPLSRVSEIIGRYFVLAKLGRSDLPERMKKYLFRYEDLKLSGSKTINEQLQNFF